MSMRSTRRRFLAATAALTWAGTRTFAAGAPKASPNETVHLGIIGCGFRGQQLIPQWSSLPGVRVAAVCDVYEPRRDQARQQAGGDEVQAYGDYRKLLDNKGIDAVVITSNDHWHLLHAVHALQSGKDVYLEKPLATSIVEGRRVIEAARKCGRVVQFGTWQRSMEHYQKAAEIVRSGRLGQISEVKVWDYQNYFPGFGSPPNSDPPQGMDWDLYLGPAPKVPYNPNRYNMPQWCSFWDYSGGGQIGWGVHHYDIVHWAMGVQGPVAVAAMGGKMAFPKDNSELPDTLDAVLQYPACPAAKQGFVMQYTYRSGCRREQRAHGKWFFGTDGALLVTRGGYWLTSEIHVQKDASQGDVIADALFWLAAKGRQIKAIADESQTSKNDSRRHLEIFVEHLRRRTQPTAEGVEVGHHASLPGHLMNIAWRVGRQIRWDAAKETIPDDQEANSLLSRTYRAPWKLDT